MAYIYKISNNINGKVYIGKTLYTIERRWKQHLTNAVSHEYLWHLPLYAAMRKYGIINFSVSEIEYVENYLELSDREKYWITQYDSYLNGYNATRGGDGSLLYDYEWIWDLWESGLKIKEISKIVECNDYIVRTVLTLHNVSTEERIQRSYDDQINSHRPFQRPIEQIDINTNEIIQEYESVSAAARAVNGDNSHLSKICNGQQNYIGYGYKWRYKPNCEYTKKDFTKRPVCKLDLSSGNILEVFESISAAARSVNGDSSYISKVCRGIQKSSKGFGWKYLELIDND